VPRGLPPRYIRPKIPECKLPVAIEEWTAAAETKQRRIIMGRWRFDADDLVRRIALRAIEVGLGWHQGDPSTDGGIVYRVADLAARQNPATQILSAAEHDISSEQHQREEGDAAGDLGAFMVGDGTQAPLTVTRRSAGFAR
jgi:hypothetical protein